MPTVQFSVRIIIQIPIKTSICISSFGITIHIKYIHAHINLNALSFRKKYTFTEDNHNIHVHINGGQ